MIRSVLRAALIGTLLGVLVAMSGLPWWGRVLVIILYVAADSLERNRP